MCCVFRRGMPCASRPWDGLRKGDLRVAGMGTTVSRVVSVAGAVVLGAGTLGPVALSVAPALAAEETAPAGTPPAAAVDSDEARIPYILEITVPGQAEALPSGTESAAARGGDGDEPQDDGLADRLRAVSQLAALQNEPPFSQLALQRRVDQDSDRFASALRAWGYYRPEIRTTVVPAEQAEGTALIKVRAEPGPIYTLDRITIQWMGEPDRDGLSVTPDSIGLTKGAPAEASVVLDASKRLEDQLEEQGRPLAKVTDRQVVVNHATRTMTVTFLVDPGPPARFGPLQVSGLEDVRESYVQNMIPWTAGDRYDIRQVRAYRKRLSNSRLFATIDLGPGSTVGPDGRIPLHLTVTEAAPRTLAVGASYATDTGPGINARWEHRNFLGEGERFRADAVLAQSEQSVDLSFVKPYFFGDHQQLTMNASGSREDQNAYKGLVGEAAIGIERKMWEHWTVSGGLAFEYASLTETADLDGDGQDSKTDHQIFGLPLSAQRDDTDNLLDPTEGTRLALSFVPWTGLVDQANQTFMTLESRGSAYQGIYDNRVVFAERFRLASLQGAALEDVPVNHRLYAGGGGSVRGYAHDLLGPLDQNDDPTGGRSAVEVGFEARIKVVDSIGVVPFVEGGYVGTEPWPDFEDPIRWAAGLGFRYYTDFGPIRADFATPLNPRDADDFFQFYISLGQAF